MTLWVVWGTMNLSAQKTLIDVKIDSAAILIGEQTALHVTVTTDKDKSVQIVIPNDTLMQGVEVLNLSKRDTTMIENDRMLIKQDLLLTSFDSSLYLLPPLKVIDGVDTVYSEQLALKVSTIPVNVDKPEEFNDIKTVWKPPFVLADYYPIIFGVLLAILLPSWCMLSSGYGVSVHWSRSRKKNPSYLLTNKPSKNWMKSKLRKFGNKDVTRSIIRSSQRLYVVTSSIVLA